MYVLTYRRPGDDERYLSDFLVDQGLGQGFGEGVRVWNVPQNTEIVRDRIQKVDFLLILALLLAKITHDVLFDPIDAA